MPPKAAPMKKAAAPAMKKVAVMKSKKSDADKSEFVKLVGGTVAKIPKGKVMTYGGVARASGKPGASIAVGQAMANNADTNVPCHRVVNSYLELTGFHGERGTAESSKEVARKKAMLENEGVTFRADGRVDISCVTGGY